MIETLDAICLQVLALIPDADFILVGRQYVACGGTPSQMWVIDFHMPRRNKAYRVMKHRMEVVHSYGETLDEALEMAVRVAYMHRTGKLPE